MRKRLKESPFWNLAFEKKNIFLFVGAFFLNAIAALFEGVSYALILFAFSALCGEKTTHFMLCIFGAIFAQIFRSGLNYFAQSLMTFLATRIQIETQKRIFKQIFRFSFRCASSYKIGDLSDYAQAPTRCTVEVIDSFNRSLVAGLIVVVCLGFMMFLSMKLTLILLLLIGLIIFLQRFVMRKIRENSKNQTEQLVTLNQEAVQSFQGLRLIFVYNLQQNILNKIKQTLKRIASMNIRLNLWNHFVLPINEIIGVFLVGVTLILGSILLKSQDGSVLPVLLTFLTLSYRLNSRLHPLMVGVGSISWNIGPLLRIDEILRDSDKEFISASGEHHVRFEQEILFQNVSLTYPKTSKTAVADLNFKIPKGKTIAIVGCSGAGKSTIIDLILHLYEPSEGSIKVDGRDLRSLNVFEWRDLLGVVSQDSIIFNESVKDNILLGNLDATQADVEEAARLAGAHAFIAKLPQGYETELGERGYRLSGGERQRIALARAMIRNPDILILDEATSNLDSFSESLIQRALENLQREKTLIIIAHRLSTVTFADHIFVLENGRVIEEGSHDDLLVRSGQYARMWELQSGQERDLLLTHY